MPERFDKMIQAVLDHGGQQHHEVLPADFGERRRRLEMFRNCLDVLVKRYPRIEVSISGTNDAIRELGLVPGVDFVVAGERFRVLGGQTTDPRAVRLTCEAKAGTGGDDERA